MPISNNEIIPLLWSYLQGKLTTEEQRDLERWRHEAAAHQQLLEELDNKAEFFDEVKLCARYEAYFDKSAKTTLRKLLAKPGSASKVVRLRKWLVAASVLAIMAMFIYLLNKESNTTPAHKQLATQPEIPPGQQKARLLLSDGSVIVLDQAKTGELAKQQGATIYNKDGQLIYGYEPEHTKDRPVYNTLITGKGETYQTTLSDGSTIWLNASSSLRFPVAFAGRERVVELKGEGYFEVKGNASKPFKVMVGDKTVEVLGTRFSVNAYTEERYMKTSLLEGKLKVSTPNKAQLLEPGQQLRIGKDETFRLISNAKVEAEISWTNGLFYFNNEDLPAVLRQLTRWYQVEVVYHGAIGPETFTGYISRELPLGDVLESISSMTQAKLELQEGKLHVYAGNKR